MSRLSRLISKNSEAGKNTGQSTTDDQNQAKTNGRTQVKRVPFSEICSGLIE
jgi:hypothetical protein